MRAEDKNKAGGTSAASWAARAAAAAFVVWSAANYLAYFARLLSGGRAAETLRRLAGF